MARKSVMMEVPQEQSEIDDDDDSDDDDETEQSYEDEEEEEQEEELEMEEEEDKIPVMDRELYAYEQNFFDEMNDEEFAKYIDLFVSENRHYVLENRVFENFLKLNEPLLLSGMAQAIQTIQEMEGTCPLWPAGIEDPDAYLPAPTLKTVMFYDKGNRINLAQSTDLVLREVEEMQFSLSDFMEKARKTKFHLKAEIEESAARIEDVELSRAAFHQDVIVDGMDPIAQRIPAEKFVWTIQEWLRSAGILAEKLRLRNSSQLTQYIKLKNLLMQKMELGECINEVDFEQMRIQNKVLAQKIEQKSIHLLELKKLNGHANLNLATHKIYLEKIISGLKTMKTAIEQTIQEKQYHDSECIVAQKELDEAEAKYNEVKHLTDNYKVPDILDYVKVKSKLHNLKKELKTLERRENIIQIVFKSAVKQMQQITGSRRVNQRWFIEDFSGVQDDSSEMLGSYSEPYYPTGTILPEFDIYSALQVRKVKKTYFQDE